MAKKYKSFAACTDDELIAMVNAHYAGEIDIRDYWEVGDLRNIHFSGTPESDFSIQEECDIPIRIIDMCRDELVTPINGQLKAALTLEFAKSLPTLVPIIGWSNPNISSTEAYIWKDGTIGNNVNDLKWWLNNDLKSALPNIISSNVKPVFAICKGSHSGTSTTQSVESVRVISVSEFCGNNNVKISSTSGETNEGDVYKYYESENNRKFFLPHSINQSDMAQRRWTRTPSNAAPDSSSRYSWCTINKDGALQNAVLTASLTWLVDPLFNL